jgi:hypothetical protein
MARREASDLRRADCLDPPIAITAMVATLTIQNRLGRRSLIWRRHLRPGSLGQPTRADRNDMHHAWRQHIAAGGEDNRLPAIYYDRRDRRRGRWLMSYGASIPEAQCEARIYLAAFSRERSPVTCR